MNNSMKKRLEDLEKKHHINPLTVVINRKVLYNAIGSCRTVFRKRITWMKGASPKVEILDI